MKDSLIQYYLHQAGRGAKRGVGPVYAVSPFLQRGSGVGSFLSGIFRKVRPLLWKDVKAVGREALRTGGNIMKDIAANNSPDLKASDIFAACLGESAQNILRKMRGGGRKRNRSASLSPAAPKRRRKSNTDSKRAVRAPRKKKAQVTKRDIFA
jgi:hypothetical protein